jgi:hypothetical protein
MSRRRPRRGVWVVDRNLHRYWVRLKTGGWPREFGVTAYSEADTLKILRYVAFAPAGRPSASLRAAPACRATGSRTGVRPGPVTWSAPAR